MTWRDLWKSTVTNLRALLGFTPPPKTPPPPPAPIVRRKPLALTAPTGHEARGENALTPHHSHHAPQTIDLNPTHAVPPPSAPLRTRKPIHVPVDVALDAAAFAAMKPKPHAPSPHVPPLATYLTPAPERRQPRQELVNYEPPRLTVNTTVRTNADPIREDGGFAAEEPTDHELVSPEPDSSLHHAPPPAESYKGNGNGFNGHHNGHHGYGGNGGDHGFDGNDGDGDEDEGVPLTTLLESLLFVAPEPVAPRQLAQTLAQPLEIIELGLTELADYYQRTLRGVRLQRFNDKVQLVSAPVAAPFIEAFLNLDNSTKLSSPALETLAVIAYRQPVTRAQIEAVRGVDCSGVLRSLIQRGLVVEAGRLEGVGRPILYGVTELFMQHFGLMGMEELPPLEETEADRLWAATVLDESA